MDGRRRMRKRRRRGYLISGDVPKDGGLRDVPRTEL